MTDAPHNHATLIAWFTATEIVRHNGTRDPREPHMTEREAVMLARRIGKPSHHGSAEQRAKNLWRAEQIWSTALEQGLFMGHQFGWIDREGSFWSCGHAAHELLLHFLELDIRTVEEGGWIRISMTGPQSIYQPSDAQIRTLIARGLEGAAKTLLEEAPYKVTRQAERAAKVR